VIRRARPDDCAAVVGCVRDAYSPHIARLGREPGPMSADYADLIARGMVYVLQPEDDSRLHGVLVLLLEGRTMWIENVAVHPDYQHRGEGRRLMAFAEEQAGAANATEMRLYANELILENIALYGRLGYTETERRPHRGFHRVFMRKPL
jgi:ribosomal protein S18 acetylase RimI-like enzyme